MEFSITDINNLKGIGPKTKDKIIKELQGVPNYVSKYDSSKHVKLNSYICGDMFEVTNGIADNSIDLILTDLPYGVTRNTWDTPINLQHLWEVYNRVLKENGAVILFGQGKFTSELVQSNYDNFRYSLVWEKDRPSGFLNARRMPLRSHEDILVFYSKMPVYNPQMWEGKPLHGRGQKVYDSKGVNNNYGDYDRRLVDDKEGNTSKFPRSVLRFNRPHPPKHATQKPVDLLEYLIKTYTHKGDTVLDTTAGIGSTCLASYNTGRNYIGIELEPTHYKIGQEMLGIKK